MSKLTSILCKFLKAIEKGCETLEPNLKLISNAGDKIDDVIDDLQKDLKVDDKVNVTIDKSQSFLKKIIIKVHKFVIMLQALFDKADEVKDIIAEGMFETGEYGTNIGDIYMEEDFTFKNLETIDKEFLLCTEKEGTDIGDIYMEECFTEEELITIDKEELIETNEIGTNIGDIYMEEEFTTKKMSGRKRKTK